MGEFARLLYKQTIFHEFEVQFRYYVRPRTDSLLPAIKRRTVLYKFDQVAKLSETREDRPRFVFSHMVVPHTPFVFGPNGEPRGFKLKESPESYRKGYVDQVQYVNKLTLKMVKTILKNSTPEPVILVVSDHGYTVPGVDRATEIRDRMGNIIFMHIPGASLDESYRQISLVNLFRVVLNQMFGKNLPLLKEQSWFTTEEQPNRLELVPESVLSEGYIR